MVCPVELQDWALDDLPTLSRAILRGALCLDGIRFPDDNDPTSRTLDPPGRNSIKSFMYGVRYVTCGVVGLTPRLHCTIVSVNPEP